MQNSDHNNMAPIATPHATTSGCNDTLHDGPTAALVELVDVAVTLVATLPIVAVGGGPFTPFIPNAVAESAANPTDAGLYRYTEYTFFFTSPNQHTSMRSSSKTKTKKGNAREMYHRRSNSAHSRPYQSQRTRRRTGSSRSGSAGSRPG